MQLKTRDGVRCDKCGLVLKRDFVYYNVDFREVYSYNSVRPDIETILAYPVKSSLDMCPNCYQILSNTVVAHYRPVAVGVNCDITGVGLNGDFVYYYAVVTHVIVFITTNAKPSITVRDRQLEFTMSLGAYEELVRKV